LIDRVPEVPVEGGSSPDFLHGEIKFENVNFSYPSRPDIPVLRNFTLDIGATSTVAFVGASGAGKSTVISLLERFYDTTGGNILIDGQPLRSLDPSWLRRNMALVAQEPVLFGSTIRENICYGVDAARCVGGRQTVDVSAGLWDGLCSAGRTPKQCDDNAEEAKAAGYSDLPGEDVERVARVANAHSFISDFPEGYETIVGERGVRLSGGQKQRIAIARALLMEPKILLLDEATSALDSESEHIVQEAIDRLMQSSGITTLVIAHRLSTVRDADAIVVVDGGSIQDVGRHEELLQRSNTYQQLVQRQLQWGDASSGESSVV